MGDALKRSQTALSEFAGNSTKKKAFSSAAFLVALRDLDPELASGCVGPIINSLKEIGMNDIQIYEYLFETPVPNLESRSRENK